MPVKVKLGLLQHTCSAQLVCTAVTEPMTAQPHFMWEMHFLGTGRQRSALAQPDNWAAAGLGSAAVAASSRPTSVLQHKRNKGKACFER